VRGVGPELLHLAPCGGDAFLEFAVQGGDGAFAFAYRSFEFGDLGVLGGQRARSAAMMLATRAMRCPIRTLWPTTHFAQREQITRPPLLVADHPQGT